MDTLHQTVASKDGTSIAYDRRGEGPAVILVAGALCARLSWSGPEIARLLAPQFTVYNYDRRGRGDSGDTPPYAVAREIEDLDALITAAGGSASLFGHSSGAALVLEAAAALGENVTKLVMYDAPYHEDLGNRQAWNTYIGRLAEMLAAGRGGDAVALFMEYTGMPADQVEGMRHAPFWPMLQTLAPTLAYDHIALLGEDGGVPAERAAAVRAPALVMYGGASHPVMRDAAHVLSRAMPHAQLRAFEGQTHDVHPEALAPVLEAFFRDDVESREGRRRAIRQRPGLSRGLVIPLSCGERTVP
ncbi:MAG: alpha/beta hydrolase [Chloroflexota bacterium]|nr:alpha/beta hydrolase [Chloroflexota bacterium]MDQ6908314.1 alpha/beta hydrolase [Chloroflexota bacterium]